MTEISGEQAATHGSILTVNALKRRVIVTPAGIKADLGQLMNLASALFATESVRRPWCSEATLEYCTQKYHSQD